MSTGTDLLSIGAIASQFGRSVDQCRTAATAAAIRPTMTLNGVPYFDRVQVGRLATRSA